MTDGEQKTVGRFFLDEILKNHQIVVIPFWLLVCVGGAGVGGEVVEGWGEDKHTDTLGGHGCGKMGVVHPCI